MQTIENRFHIFRLQIYEIISILPNKERKKSNNIQISLYRNRFADIIKMPFHQRKADQVFSDRLHLPLISTRGGGLGLLSYPLADLSAPRGHTVLHLQRHSGPLPSTSPPHQWAVH